VPFTLTLKVCPGRICFGTVAANNCVSDDDFGDGNDDLNDNNNNNNNSDEDYSYITSILNNHDCIPRFTKSNLFLLQKLLRWTTYQKKLFLRKKNRYFSRQKQQQQQQQLLSPSPSQPPPFLLSSDEWKRFWKTCEREEQEAEHEKRRTKTKNMLYQRWENPIYSDNNSNRVCMEESVSESFTGNDLKNKNTRHPHRHRHHHEHHYDRYDNTRATTAYIVPGKIVSIWNNTQDSNIIGTKIYSDNDHHYRRRSQRRNGNDSCSHNYKNYSNSVLGQLWIDESMFYDHTIEAYRSNLELLLGQAANTI